MLVRRALRPVVLVAGGAFLAIAAVAPVVAQSEAGVTTVIARDYYFADLPTSVPAGTQLGLSNEGTEFHELAVARVNDDVTESVQELLALPEEEVLSKVTIFEPLFASAGTAAEGTIALEQEGRYVALCFIPQGTSGTIDLSTATESSPPEGLGDGPAHAFLGMLQEFTVTAPGSSPGPLPQTPPASPEVAPSAPAARVVELELNGSLQIVQSGQQVTELNVAIGETITFRLTNTAGFAHNMYIGTPEELSVPAATTPVGVPDFTEGTVEFTWTVPENAGELQFACTFPGHYAVMHGTFVVGG